MYAKTSQSLSQFDRKYPQTKALDAFALSLPLKTRNLAIEVVTSHFCEVTNRDFGRNLANRQKPSVFGLLLRIQVRGYLSNAVFRNLANLAISHRRLNH